MRAKRKKIWTAVFVTAVLAVALIALAGCSTASIGIIGGADGPTKLFLGKSSVADESGEDDAANGGKTERLKSFPDQAALKDAQERGLLILVNKQNSIDEAYKPEDLASIRYFAADRSEAGRYMRQEAADHFHALSEAAAAEGYEIVVTTAYRSYGFQKTLYDNYVAREGQEAADRFSARPGTSEHQTGLAADVSSPSVGYELSYEYDEAPEGKWLAENAHRFGFIIRFPENKTDITGYNYEPWHIRYVGEAVAQAIFDNNLTLEEFLEEVQ